MTDIAEIKAFMAAQEQWNKGHQMSDNAAFGNLQKTVDEIKDNHLIHMEEAIRRLQEDVSKVITDMDWLKKFFWIVATASIGGLLTGVINLIMV